MSRAAGDPIITPGEAQEFPRAYFSLGADALVSMRGEGSGASAQALASLDQLAARCRTEPTLPIGALVFHCSRCGSTLLARLFQLDPTTRIFAEPEALPQFLSANSAALLRGERQAELRTFIQAFGLSPTSRERRLVLKLTSLSLPYLPTFRACFPDVPFIYLLREPVEVVASLANHEPGFLHDGRRGAIAAIFGRQAGEVQHLRKPAWFAWYVAQNLQRAFELRGEFRRAIDHAELRAGYLDLVNEISGTHLTPAAPEVAQTLAEHSKGPRRTFLPPAQTDLAVLREIVAPIAADAYSAWRGPLPAHGRTA